MGDDLPYFKFFVGDWLADMNVRAMDPAERGIYMDLLALDWKEGGIPDDVEFLAKALNVDADAMRSAWETLSGRFVSHPEKSGWLTNRRLSKERQELQEEREKRSEAARKAANARWSKNGSSDPDANAERPQSDSTTRASGSGSSSGSDSQEGEEHEKGETPETWMHEVWHEELGIEGHRIKLTDKRRSKYRAMYEEQLEATDDPKRAWKMILRRVQMSDHHMSERSYQMPESLLRNPERRETWVQRTLEAARKGTTSADDRKRDAKKDRIRAAIENLEAAS